MYSCIDVSMHWCIDILLLPYRCIVVLMHCMDVLAQMYVHVCVQCWLGWMFFCLKGFGAVILACFTSGFAGVWIQKMLQQTGSSVSCRSFIGGFSLDSPDSSTECVSQSLYKVWRLQVRVCQVRSAMNSRCETGVPRIRIRIASHHSEDARCPKWLKHLLAGSVLSSQEHFFLDIIQPIVHIPYSQGTFLSHRPILSELDIFLRLSM